MGGGEAHHRHPYPVVWAKLRQRLQAGSKSRTGWLMTYEEGEGLLEFRDLFLGERVGL